MLHQQIIILPKSRVVRLRELLLELLGLPLERPSRDTQLYPTSLTRLTRLHPPRHRPSQHKTTLHLQTMFASKSQQGSRQLVQCLMAIQYTSKSSSNKLCHLDLDPLLAFRRPLHLLSLRDGSLIWIQALASTTTSICPRSPLSGSSQRVPHH